jgi:hypothetical protein
MLRKKVNIHYSSETELSASAIIQGYRITRKPPPKAGAVCTRDFFTAQRADAAILPLVLLKKVVPAIPILHAIF